MRASCSRADRTPASVSRRFHSLRFIVGSIGRPSPERTSTRRPRREITQHISDVKSRISFYTGWMAIHGSAEVRAAYDALVAAAQREAARR